MKDLCTDTCAAILKNNLRMRNAVLVCFVRPPPNSNFHSHSVSHLWLCSLLQFKLHKLKFRNIKKFHLRVVKVDKKLTRYQSLTKLSSMNRQTTKFSAKSNSFLNHLYTVKMLRCPPHIDFNYKLCFVSILICLSIRRWYYLVIMFCCSRVWPKLFEGTAPSTWARFRGQVTGW